MKIWTHRQVELLKDYLILYGDLVLKSGQTAILPALANIPEILSEMDAWCDHWLDEQGRSKVVKSVLGTH